MIVQSGSYRYMIDVGRPSFTEDSHRDAWKRFFEIVEQSPYPVVVNGQYDNMHDLVYAGSSYLGNGFSFCFWFASKDHRKYFVKDCAAIQMSIEDPMNLRFYIDLDKTMHVKCTEKYGDAARAYMADRPALTFGENLHGYIMVNGPRREIIELKAHLLECWLDFDD